jgi:hypothetical protein
MKKRITRKRPKPKPIRLRREGLVSIDYALPPPEARSLWLEKPSPLKRAERAAPQPALAGLKV